jgi:hypothetical protein
MMPEERSHGADPGPVTGAVEGVRQLPVGDKAPRPGFGKSRFHLVGSCARGEIDERPCGRGSGNPILDGAVAAVEVSQSVYTESIARPAVPRYNAYFHFGSGHVRKTPEESGRTMAHEGPVAIGEHRSQFARARNLQRMPD